MNDDVKGVVVLVFGGLVVLCRLCGAVDAQTSVSYIHQLAEAMSCVFAAA